MNDKHIERILYNSSYKIDEDAKFNKIDSSYFDNDDDVLNIIGEDEEDENQEQEETDTDDENLEGNQEVEGDNEEELSDEEPTADDEIELGDDTEQPEEDSEKNVDLVQNKIIKTTINTMNMIHDKMRELENSVNNLDTEYQKLKNDVDEVKEPTNKEKLKQHTEDSHPYYKNLNDVWKSDDKGNKINDEGIIQLSNGQYVAIFDDLGNMSSVDVNKSFYQYE